MTLQDLISKLDALDSEFSAAIRPLSDEPAIPAAHVQYLGKNGRLPELQKELGRLPANDKKPFGQALNRVKQNIETSVAERLAQLANVASEKDLARKVDVTLPARPVGGGHLHLLTQVRLEAV